MDNEAKHEVRVTVEGRDVVIPMDNLGVNIDSSEREILAAVRPMVREAQGVDLNDEAGEVAFTVRKALNSDTIYVYPKPVAG